MFQNINVNAGVTQQQAVDIANANSDALRRAFAREAGQAGTQIRRSIQGAGGGRR